LHGGDQREVARFERDGVHAGDGHAARAVEHETIMITGCSSGFGLGIARHFLARDWQVIAMIRTTRSSIMPASA